MVDWWSGWLARPPSRGTWAPCLSQTPLHAYLHDEDAAAVANYLRMPTSAPSADERIRLEEPEEASPLAAGDMPDPVPGPSAAAAPAPGVHFAVAGTVNQRLEAYFLCMKKLFGVDAAAGVTWLSRCAAIFPAFARHNSGDRVLTNNVLESYHRWLKHEHFT